MASFVVLVVFRVLLTCCSAIAFGLFMASSLTMKMTGSAGSLLELRRSSNETTIHVTDDFELFSLVVAGGHLIWGAGHLIAVLLESLLCVHHRQRGNPLGRLYQSLEDVVHHLAALGLFVASATWTILRVLDRSPGLETDLSRELIAGGIFAALAALGHGVHAAYSFWSWRFRQAGSHF